MSSICLSQVALSCTVGGADKLYVIQVQQDDATFIAMGYSGRRGSALKEQEKYRGPSLPAAQAAASKVERAKRTSSSYSTFVGTSIPGMPSTAPVAAVGGATPVPIAARAVVASTGPIVMLANVLLEADLAKKMKDPNWVIQCKYDGERFPVSVRRGEIQGFNRKGQVRPMTAAAEACLTNLTAQPDFNDNRESVLDCELMGDVLVIFDMTMLRDNDVTDLSFDERYAALEELLSSQPDLLAPVAWSTEEKAAMYERAQAENWEGLMLRNIASTYTAGRTGNLLKCKFWATCSCRVLSVNALRSIQVALLDESGDEVFVGNVSVPVNQSIPEPDDLVEVRYLYAMEGGSLYQPTLLGLRTDIDEADKRSELRPCPPEKGGKPSASASSGEVDSEI